MRPPTPESPRRARREDEDACPPHRVGECDDEEGDGQRKDAVAKHTHALEEVPETETGERDGWGRKKRKRVLMHCVRW